MTVATFIVFGSADVNGMRVAGPGNMTMDLKVLKCGNCEPLKLGVHGLVLGLAAVCGLYNAAAWLNRREQHLAFNTVLYAVLIAFEQQHVSHHIAELRRPKAPSDATTASSVENVVPIVAAVVPSPAATEIAA
jgi:hypothetical protein